MSLIVVLFLQFQNILFSGIVLDTHTKQPVAGAQVFVVEQNIATTTNDSGYFSAVIPNADLKKATVKIVAFGYHEMETQIALEQGVELQLIPKDELVEEILLVAIRSEEHEPVTQKTLDKKDIERNYFGQEMPYVLQQTPSITVQSDGGNFSGYSYFRLRGIDQTRINFSLNGVPLNEPEDQGVYFANFQDFGNSLNSVQVQRGVGTTAFGTASYGGSVNFESVNLGLEKKGAEVQTSYGSFNTYRMSAEVFSGRTDENNSFYARYSVLGSDGYRYHSGTNANSFFVSGAHFGKKDLFKVTAFSGRSANQMAYLAASLPDIKYDPRTNYLSRNENDIFAQDMIIVQHIRELGDYSNLTSSIFYNHLNGGFDVQYYPSVFNYSVLSNFTGFTTCYNFNNSKSNVHLGISGNLYQRNHKSYEKPNEELLLYSNHGFKEEVSAFAKLSQRKNDFIFNLDLQVRNVWFSYVPDGNYHLQVSPVSWTFFNPKAGISKLAGKTRLYISAGKNSREPTRTDLFAGFDDLDTNNISLIGDFTRVKPETVYDLEAGVDLIPAKNINWNINAYWMEFRNEIAAIGQLSYLGLPLRKNVPSSFRKGIESDFNAQITKNLILFSSITISRNRIRKYFNEPDQQSYQNIQPLLTPQFISYSGVRYSYRRRFEIEVNARSLSRSFLDNTGNDAMIVPSSVVFNSRISIPVKNRLFINFQVYNILNRLYYTAGYTGIDNAGNLLPFYYVQAPRSYFLTLQIKI